MYSSTSHASPVQDSGNPIHRMLGHCPLLDQQPLFRRHHLNLNVTIQPIAIPQRLRNRNLPPLRNPHVVTNMNSIPQKSYPPVHHTPPSRPRHPPSSRLCGPGCVQPGTQHPNQSPRTNATPGNPARPNAPNLPSVSLPTAHSFSAHSASSSGSPARPNPAFVAQASVQPGIQHPDQSPRNPPPHPRTPPELTSPSSPVSPLPFPHCPLPSASVH